MELSDKDIISKYINGTCTDQELERVRAIMAAPGYSKWVDELLSEDGNPVHSGMNADLDKDMQVWIEKINLRIAGEGVPDRKQSPFYLRYAAIWLLSMLAAGLFAIRYFGKQQPPVKVAWVEKYNPKGKRTQLTLTDGTVIILGADSRLRFPERFTDTLREFFLTGEAFFEVAHKPGKPFIVHTQDIQTRVLGTSFRITSFRGDATTVSVATGKVVVDDVSGQQRRSIAVLTPGKQLVYEHQQSRLATVSVDDLQGWKEGHLVYTSKPLKDIAKELERWYKVNFAFTDPEKGAVLMDMNITTSGDIDQVMRVLSASGGFSYQIAGNKITIY